MCKTFQSESDTGTFAKVILGYEDGVRSFVQDHSGRHFHGRVHDTGKDTYRQIGIEYKESAFSVPCDAYAFKEVSGTEVVIIGPKGGNFHGADEYIEIDSLFQVIRIMALGAVNYCN